MDRTLSESLPILVLFALYAYFFWYYVIEIGLNRLTWQFQILPLLIGISFVGGGWFFFGEPEGPRIVGMFGLMLLPLIYLIILIGLAVFRG